MSGITPLLDTLLHQVLGKRVDIPTPRDLNEPVRPVAAGEGPRALHGDSRLEGRRPAPLPAQGAAAAPQREMAARPAADGGHAPASAQTHFSPSGRTIADLLIRFPAPPSVLTSPAALMREGEPPQAATLAARLQGSVRDSGLFYEAHLSRWYRGEVSRQQLEQEPQMWRTLRFTPVATAAQAAAAQGTTVQTAAAFGQVTAPAGGAPLTSSAVVATATLEASRQASRLGEGGAMPDSGRSSARPLEVPSRMGMPGGEAGAKPGLASTEAQPPAGREALEASHRVRGGAEPVHESLQGLVRHQLEMLVTPVLRWEGDVWAGIFLALVVNVPPGARREEEKDQDDGDEPGGEAWHSEMTLRVPSLGDIGVAMWLQGTQLRLELSAFDTALRDRLEREAGLLEQRLQDVGLTRVLIDVRRGERSGEGRGEEWGNG